MNDATAEKITIADINALVVKRIDIVKPLNLIRRRKNSTSCLSDIDDDRAILHWGLNEAPNVESQH